MSTRSHIAIENDDGTVTAVYCHFDGYPRSGVGETLFKYWNNRDTLNEVMEHGPMSSLGTCMASTEFYCRDRGETDVSSENFESVDGFFEFHDVWIEYRYLMKKDGTWVYEGGYSNGVVPLSNAMEHLNT